MIASQESSQELITTGMIGYSIGLILTITAILYLSWLYYPYVNNKKWWKVIVKFLAVLLILTSLIELIFAIYNINKLYWNDFSKVDMCMGTILMAELFEEAMNPSYKIQIDFGSSIGVLKSSVQITTLYSPKELIGKQIIAVVNFPPKQIANMMSECLVLDCNGEANDVILLQPEHQVKNGAKIG